MNITWTVNHLCSCFGNVNVYLIPGFLVSNLSTAIFGSDGVVNNCRMRLQVSAYASFGRINGIGPTVEKQRRRMDLNSNEPQFTNCTRDFLGTLDYIFYTGKSFALTENSCLSCSYCLSQGLCNLLLLCVGRLVCVARTQWIWIGNLAFLSSVVCVLPR